MKRKAKLLLGIAAVLLWMLTTAVSAKENGHVYDQYGLLDDTEVTMLNEKFEELYDTYHFDAVLLISRDVVGDERRYAASFMQENEIGYGGEKNGMCIFHQPDARIITIVFRGSSQEQFTEKIQDIMLDSCTEELKEGNMAEAYVSLLDDLKAGLERIENGKTIRPMDIEDGWLVLYALKWLLLSLGIMAIPVLLLVLVQVMRMKTKRMQENADFYAPQECFDLQMCRDIYLRTDVTKVKIEHENHNQGGSGTFKSGGESFSGSSRKY